MSNSVAIGVAYSDPEFTTCYASQQIGYTTAAQGAVTQGTDKSTAVTLNYSMGRITMNAASLASNTAVSFTLNNNLLGSNDTIIVNVSGGGTSGAYTAYVSSLSAGAAVMTLRNLTGGALAEAVILNYAIIHGQ